MKTLYRVFSLTWPASMQIYWNKRKRLHKKRVQLPQDWFRTPTWPPFHCFGTPIWPPRRHVKTPYRGGKGLTSTPPLPSSLVGLGFNTYRYLQKREMTIFFLFLIKLYPDVFCSGCLLSWSRNRSLFCVLLVSLWTNLILVDL